jgi:hypothetical protein
MGMGEQKRRAQQFEQQTDEALANDIKQDNLFSKTPVKCNYSYECVLESQNSPLKAGGNVRLIDMKDRIDVFVDTQPIGYVLPSNTKVLREQLRLNERKGRSVHGQAIDVSEFTPTFTVRVGE